MALRGNLRDFSLPDVFQLVTLSGKTGVLRIKRADAEGSIWFRDGEIFFAQSDWHREPLGTRLVSAAKITPNALSKALEIQKGEPADGRRLGQILIDEGYVTPQILEAFVQEQIQDTIFDLFRWDEGDFDFEPLESAPAEDIGLSVSIENVVMEGSRRLEEWNRIKKKIPSMEIVFKMATAPGEGTFDISLKPAEWNLLLKVDGTRSVAEMAHDFNRTDFEIARVVYGLFSAGLLEVASDEEVVKLRAERAELEAKYADVDAQRREAEEKETLAALEREAQLVAEAQARSGQAAEAPAAPVEEEPAAAEEAPLLEVEAPMEAPAPEAEAPAPEAEAPVEEHVPEEPAFLAGAAGTAEPDAADMAAFEAMVGAVLQVPAAEVEEAPAEEAAAEEAPAEEALEEVPALEPVAGTPYVIESLEGEEEEEAAGPEAAPEAAAAGIEPVEEDFESGLLAMGLGELPGDLLAPVGTEAEPEAAEEEISAEEAAAVFEGAEVVAESAAESALEEEPAPAEAASDEAVPAWEQFGADVGVVEPASVAGTVEPEPVVAAPEESEELTDLLSSLEAETAEEAAVLDTSAVGLDLGEALEETGEGEAPAGGVISTDAFLADFSSGDASFSTGMGDELAALTGGGGARRPQASAKKIPQTDEGKPALHRDQEVDRDLLERIIDGVKKL